MLEWESSGALETSVQFQSENLFNSARCTLPTSLLQRPCNRVRILEGSFVDRDRLEIKPHKSLLPATRVRVFPANAMVRFSPRA